MYQHNWTRIESAREKGNLRSGGLCFFLVDKECAIKVFSMAYALYSGLGGWAHLVSGGGWPGIEGAGEGRRSASGRCPKREKSARTLCSANSSKQMPQIRVHMFVPPKLPQVQEPAKTFQDTQTIYWGVTLKGYTLKIPWTPSALYTSWSFAPPQRIT
jgi:hypothetical protein